MSNCGQSTGIARPTKDHDELYVCDCCKLVAGQLAFEFADKDGQLCMECVLEHF